MVRISQYLAAACAGAALLSGSAQAQSLMESLAAAYRTNPTLQAQRAQLRATDEQLAQVRALILPTVNAEASFGRQESRSSGTFPFSMGDPTDPNAPPGDSTYSNSSASWPYGVGLTLSQRLFDGGAFGAGRRQVMANIGREGEALRGVEQTVLLDAVSAFMDVRRAEEEVVIRMNNVDVLETQRRATSARFDQGEVTRTDVAQAGVRLAAAQSELTAAQATLQQQRAIFERIMGFPAGTLEAPPPPPNVPETLEEAVAAAGAYSPQLNAAVFAVESAEHNVRVQRADLMPGVTLDANVGRREDSSFPGDRNDSYSVTANLRVPLFTGGQEQSQVREARQLVAQARQQMEAERRAVTENVTAAWSGWRAAQAVVESSRAGVEASELAFEGVRREAEAGLRTTLDVLNAEQEALSARVALVSAERDAYVAAHQLLAAMGLLNVEYLGVPVEAYDPQAYRREVVGGFPGNLFGLSVD